MDVEAVRTLKNARVAALAQAFASPVRLRLLAVLAQAEHSVDALAVKLGQSRANTSAQLKVLASVGLVRSRREGRQVRYELADDGVHELLGHLHRFAMAQDPELRELDRNHYELESPLTRTRVKAIRAGLRDGSLALIDLRPVEEYEAGHPEGASSFPASELARRARQLPDRPLLVYCRGRWCPVAAHGVEWLRNAGHDAVNLGASVRELTRLGLRAV